MGQWQCLWPNAKLELLLSGADVQQTFLWRWRDSDLTDEWQSKRQSHGGNMWTLRPPGVFSILRKTPLLWPWCCHLHSEGWPWLPWHTFLDTYGCHFIAFTLYDILWLCCVGAGQTLESLKPKEKFLLRIDIWCRKVTIPLGWVPLLSRELAVTVSWCNLY